MVLEGSDGFSDSLVWRMFGGTMFSSILLLCKYPLMVVGTLLSMMLIFGSIPLFLKRVWVFVVAVI